MQRFVTIGDAEKGFTLIAKGLPEYELKLDSHGELALTLLRCVGKLSGRDLTTRPGGAAGWWNETPEAQCHGTHTFEYSLFPHGPLGANVWTAILEQVEAFATPMIAVKRKNQQTTLENSFLSVSSPSLVLTALKRSDDERGIVVRLSNPVDVPADGVVHFGFPVTSVQRATMREEPVEPLTLSEGNDCSVHLKPFEVFTMFVIA
jgi:mannosylglycerate hydrolase